MNCKKISLGKHNALLYGDSSDSVWLFVHGKDGSKEECADFSKTVCPKGFQALSVDLPEHGARKQEIGFDPWHVVPELKTVMEYMKGNWSHIYLRANSIGAWFSMQAFADCPPDRALFVSPILDMNRLISDMMIWASVDPEHLKREQKIHTNFGETLSWKYYQYAKSNPISHWGTSTSILYAGRDNLTSRDTVYDFAQRFNCSLDIMENGEHWFHTDEQLSFLHTWEDKYTSNI